MTRFVSVPCFGSWTARWSPPKKTLGQLAFLAPPVLAAAIFAMPDARAQLICNAPLDPVCSQEEISTTDDAAPAQKRCISDIEKFVKQIDEYISCTQQQVEDAQRQKQEAQALIESMKAEIKPK